MLIKTLNATGIVEDWDVNLIDKERNWLRGLQPQGHKNLSFFKPCTNAIWILRLNKDGMDHWLRNQKVHKKFS